MSRAWWSQTQAVVADIPSAYGVLLAPPIAFNVVAEQANDESQSAVTGRFHQNRGYVTGHDSPKRQDTYLTGTGGLTGRPFSSVTGTWNNLKSPYYDQIMVGMLDSTPATAFDIVSTAPTGGIEAAEIIVHRGAPGAGGVYSGYTAANTNAYLHLAYNQAPYADYRIAFEYGRAIRLDVSNDGSRSMWRPVMSANRYIAERYFQDNDEACRLRVWYDSDTTELWVEIGNGDQLHYVCGRNSPGNIRLVGKNGWAGLEYYPLRHAPPVLDKGAQALVATPHPNAGNARVATNALTPTPSNQNVTTNVNTDGVNFAFSASASRPDAGDGLGSADAPKLSDMTLLIDEVYGSAWPDDISVFLPTYLRILATEETMTWDDNLRCVLTSGRLTLNNFTGQYNGAFGNFAIALAAAIGRYPNLINFVTRCLGIAGAGEEGIQFFRKDPTRLAFLPYADKRVLMMVPLGQEVIFDGWCLYAAVRWIARCCNIAPAFLSFIPYWPDGPAGSDCPYAILARGTGRNAKYKFTPEMSGWSILLLLAQDAGLPVTSGLSLPYFTGFDPLGNLRFEPYDPLANLPAVFFTANVAACDYLTTYPILGPGLTVGNSTAQLRSETNVQGLDPLSYQLVQVHQSTSLAVRKALGYRYTALERSARFGANAVDISNTLTSVCSLPSQVIRFRSLFLPGLFPGQTMNVYERTIGLQRYVITSMVSRRGSDASGRRGQREMACWYTGRNVSAYPTASGILY